MASDGESDNCPNVAKYSSLPFEKEVLFPPGTQFLVTKDADKKHMLKKLVRNSFDQIKEQSMDSPLRLCRSLTALLVMPLFFAHCNSTTKSTTNLAAVEKNQDAPLRTTSTRPMIMIHGWGTHGDFITKKYSYMGKFKRLLEESGFQVMPVEYDERQSLPEIEKSVTDSIIAIMNTNAGQFDVVGHSFGHYLSTAALLKGRLDGKPLSTRVVKLIGLAGILNGQDTFGLCDNNRERCGGIIDLRPFRRWELLSEQEKGQEHFQKSLFGIPEQWNEFQRLKKCSLVATNDAIVNSPNESSRFGSASSNVVKNVHDVELIVDEPAHKQIKDDRKYANLMIRECYNDEAIN